MAVGHLTCENTRMNPGIGSLVGKVGSNDAVGA